MKGTWPSAQKYAAGTVAMVTGTNRPEPYRAFFDGEVWREVGFDFFHLVAPSSVRPLVVLDLSDPASVAALLRNTATGNVLRDLANQIEAQTKPPKPAEPTGLGAVVEDAEGRRFVRTLASAIPWIDADDTDLGHNDADIDVVKVLSEGVTA